MAITHVANSTIAAGTGDITVVVPTGTTTDDMMVMWILADGDGTFTTPSGWTAVAATPPRADNNSAVDHVALQAYTRIATSGSESNVTYTDSGSSTFGWMSTFRPSVGDLELHSYTTGTLTTASTAVSVTAPATTASGCMMVYFAAVGDNTSTIGPDNWTASSLDSETAIPYQRNSAGNDKMGAGCYGIYSSTGTPSNATCVIGNSERQAKICIAIEEVTSSPITAEPGTGSLAVTGQAPTLELTANHVVSPGAGSIGISGYAPTIPGTTYEIPVDAGSLSLTGYAPTVISGDIAELPIILGPTLEVTGYPPIAYIQEHVDVGTGSLSLVGRAPTVLLLGSSGPPAGSLTLEGYAPTVDVTTNHIVSPDTGSLSLSGHAPGNPSGPSTQPDVGSLQLTGYAPTVGIYQLITIEVLLGPTLSLVGYAPTAVMTEHWYPKPETGALTLTGHQPTVFMGANRGVSPGAGSLSLTGHAPVALLDGDLGLGVPDGSLALTGYAPTVAMTDNKIIPIEAGILALTGYAPTIYTGVPLVASKVNGIGI